MVLVSLGPKIASHIIAGLGEAELRQLAVAASNLQGRVKDSKKNLERFVQGVDGVEGILARSDRVLRDITADSHGEHVARRVFDDLNSPIMPSLMDTLEQADSEVVAAALQREQPQTIALVLGALGAERASEVLEHIDEETRADVIRRLAFVDAVSPDVLRQVSVALAENMAALRETGTRNLDGKNMALQLIRRSSSAEQEKAIEAIGEKDAELAEWLRSRLFTFDDVLGLTDREIQLLLREISADLLVTALKGTPTSNQERVLSNMSSRGAAMIRDDLEQMRPTPVEVVEEAQKEIVKIAMGLADAGQIVLTRSSKRLV